MERLFENLYAVGAEPHGACLFSSSQIRQYNYLQLRSDRGGGGCASRAGAITRQYLNHLHQAMPSCDWVSEWFGAPLFVPEAEKDEISKTCRVGGTFSKREIHFDDFEVIPVPGHIESSSCFLWTDREHRYLFTGDTIYLKDDEWATAVLSNSDRTRYLESAKLIGELDFDVIVPSMSRGNAIQSITERERISKLAAVIDRLAQGDDA
jgi:hypothetical protein